MLWGEIETMKYYGIGTKSVKEKGSGESSVVSVIITYGDDAKYLTRVQQVNGIQSKAARDRVSLEGIYPIAGNKDHGAVMTKGIRAQKRAAHKKQLIAYKKKQRKS